MKKTRFYLALTAMALMLAGCGNAADNTTIADVTATENISDTEGQDSTASDKVADSDEMVEPEDVVEEGMKPVYADSLKEGTYDVEVKSSSSMFKITKCELTIANGEMTAAMTMGGTGYLYLYMGTGEEAAAASESDYIPYEENENGEHTFTVPVEALDAGINCAAYSRKKEKWYDRVLLFRSDSLPQEALSEGAVTNLELEDGTYTVAVTLTGGSGKATVESPALLTVADGKMTLTLIWNSPNYDYMMVDGEKYLPVSSEDNSIFEIPVSGFDYKMAVTADTTAMSTPHEIEYTLQLDSSSVEKAK